MCPGQNIENYISHKKEKSNKTHNRVFLYKWLQFFIYIALYTVL